MATEFVAPSWLDDESADTIHTRMMENLPDGIDDTEGGFPWDFTRPTALEIAQMLEYELMETIKIMHYMFAYSVYLDYHAEAYGLVRKEANSASGVLTIVGTPGITIEEGFLFAVPASGDVSAITFYTTEEVTINDEGVAEVTVIATEAGTSGNVAANSITIMASPISGIESISNGSALTGGTDEESDDSLRERITEVLASADISYVGNDADYKRWAKAVSGVGDVIVMAEYNGAGTVQLVIFDENGEPANDQILEAVYNYIVSPDDRDSRLAPIGATVTVIAPSTITIDISCTLTTDDDFDRDEVVAEIEESLASYLSSLVGTGEVRRNKIGSLIIGTDGVTDYDDLLINESEDIITFEDYEYPELGTFTANEAETA